MVTIVYVVGWQRSGSTVLGNLLGSLSGAVHVGELTYLGHRHNPGDCGCGQDYPDCPLWSEVVPSLPFDLADWHRARDRAHRLPQLPRELRRWRREGRPSAYAAMTEVLYRQIAQTSGASVVVDSSKSPGGALALLETEDLEAHVIHLVRDPRAVAFSLAARVKNHGRDGRLGAMKQRSVPGATTRWLAANAATERYVRAAGGGRVRQLRYEDLVASPRSEVASLVSWWGGDTALLPFRGEHEAVLEDSHAVMGNPNKFGRGTTVLRVDDEWRNGLSRSQRVASSAVAAPLLGRYGYPLRTED